MMASAASASASASASAPPAAPVPALGVITVTFNAATFLRSFLACCLAQTQCDFALLVIDNCSADNTLAVLSEVQDARVQVLANKQNIGYAAACNQALDYFRERGVSDVLFINNDTEFAPDLFASLLALRVRFNADAVTPRVCYAEDTRINWYAGGRFTFWKGFQGEHLGDGQLHDPADVVPRWTPVAPGCCVLFPLATFERIGLFDPNYFVYFEDTDYFLRMARGGLRLLYAPGTVIAHKISLSTGGALSDFSIRYYQRNQMYILRKHFGPATVALQVVLLFLKASVRLLLRRDSLHQYALRLSSLVEGWKMPLPQAALSPAVRGDS